MDMSNKRVLVTGAASGIGRATALAFARCGATHVACVDIHEDGNRDTVEQVQRTGAQALAVTMDLARVPEIRSAYAQVQQAFGRIDAAAHIGGYSWRGNSLEVTEEQWDAVVNVNLRSTFFCCQEALKIMQAQGSGAIVNMSADAVFYPMEGFAVQAAAKGGIVHMTRTLALEAARRGVRLNVVSPGIVQVQKSGFVAASGAPVQGLVPAAQSFDELPGQTAPGRWIQASEVADTVVYLCSSAASGVNGDLISINGGGYFALKL